MIKVVIVDDHPIVRQGLTQLLVQEPDIAVCGEADEIRSALRLIDELKPDVVIADLSLRAGSGIDLIKSLRTAHGRVPILVLSMHDEIHHVERALRAGANGYLTKQEASAKVIEALRCVLRGDMYLSDQLSPRVLKRLLDGQGDDDPLVSLLSERELQVFRLIGDGLGTQEIADRLQLSVKTIETYQAHIKGKLDLKDSRKLTQYAIRWSIEKDV